MPDEASALEPMRPVDPKPTRDRAVRAARRFGCAVLALFSGLTAALLLLAFALVWAFSGCEPGRFAADCDKTAITKAAHAHDVRRVGDALAHGASPTAENSNGVTPLTCAWPHVATVEVLLDAGASLSEIPDPLDDAVRSDDPDLVDLVLRRDAARSASRADDALVAAASTSGACGAAAGDGASDPRRRRTVELLLDGGAPPTPALGPAIGSGYPDVALTLLAAGANPEGAKPDDEWHDPTPLLRAAFCQRPGMVTALLAAGAHPDAASRVDPARLSDEAPQRSIPSLAPDPACATTSSSAPPNPADELDQLGRCLRASAPNVTPLGAAAFVGNVPIATQLLNAGAHVDLGSGPYSPLHLAAANDDAAMCETLLAHGATATLTAPGVPTPLDLARANGATNAIAALGG